MHSINEYLKENESVCFKSSHLLMLFDRPQPKMFLLFHFLFLTGIDRLTTAGFKHKSPVHDKHLWKKLGHKEIKLKWHFFYPDFMLYPCRSICSLWHWWLTDGLLQIICTYHQPVTSHHNLEAAENLWQDPRCHAQHAQPTWGGVVAKWWINKVRGSIK